MTKNVEKSIDLGSQSVRTERVKYEKSFNWTISNFLDWIETVDHFEHSPALHFMNYTFRLCLLQDECFCKEDGPDYQHLVLLLGNYSSEDVKIKYSTFIIKDDGTKEHIRQATEYSDFKKTKMSNQFVLSPHRHGCLSFQTELPKLQGDKLPDLMENTQLFCGSSVTFGVKIEMMLLKDGGTSLERNLTIQKTLCEKIDDEIYGEEDSLFEAISDFTIECGDPEIESFPCHKVFLYLRSPVFKAMLSHDTQEAKQGKVYISDVSPQTIKSMLKFFYTDCLEDSMIDADLLAAANKYQVEPLMAICEEYLARSLSVENASELALHAQQYGSSELKEATGNFIINHFDAIKKTDSFGLLKQRKDTLISIMCREC